MAASPQQPIHTVEIPTGVFPLLVPSATIAEVVNVSALAPLPFSQDWLIGVMGWRTRPIPVVSFEALLGAAAWPPGARSKVVIFYPLAGRREWEFFGVLSAAEPQPHTIGQGEVIAAELPDNAYIGAALRLGDRLLAIPDLDRLKSLFYPA